MQQARHCPPPVDPSELIAHLQKLGIDLEDCDLDFGEPEDDTPTEKEKV